MRSYGPATARPGPRTLGSPPAEGRNWGHGREGARQVVDWCAPMDSEHPARRRIVVDGSNLATEGRTLPSLAQLNEAIETFLEEYRGSPPRT